MCLFFVLSTKYEIRTIYIVFYLVAVPLRRTPKLMNGFAWEILSAEAISLHHWQIAGQRRFEHFSSLNTRRFGLSRCRGSSDKW